MCGYLVNLVGRAFAACVITIVVCATIEAWEKDSKVSKTTK